MSSKQNSQFVAIAVIGGLVIFIVGIAIGMFFPWQLSMKKSASTGNNDTVLTSTMKSGVVSSILLYGTVKNVSGQSVTISKNSTSATVMLDAATKFYTVNYAQNSAQQPSTLNALKSGQAVELSVKVTDDNQLSAVAVITLLPK